MAQAVERKEPANLEAEMNALGCGFISKTALTKLCDDLTADMFYDEKNSWKLWAEYGVLGIEMEAAELYTLAAKYRRQALAILTVSDNIVTHQETTPEERQKTFNAMIEIALETAIS